jgi:spore coat protein H
MIRVPGTTIVALLAMGVLRGQPPAPAPLTADDLFDTTAVHDIMLTVHSRDWAELQERYRENVYYVADLRWRGEVVRNLGIRSRGQGSRNAAKPGLRLDFNRYASNQKFLGLKSLVLDNLTQDPAMLKERVAMQFFTEMGIPAPRVVHARLFVNNRFVGLYTIVEAIDKRFLESHFGEDDGYLYEFHYTDPYGFEYLGSELERYAEFFEPKTHEYDSMASLYRPIRELAWTISESLDSMFVASLGEYLDLKTFLTYVAIENFLADRDGFLGDWGMNNFYLYRFEKKMLSQLLPWDKDSSFQAADYDIWTNVEANALMRRAMNERPLRLLYVEALRRCAELALRLPEPAPEPTPEIKRPRRMAEKDEPRWLERQISFTYAQIREIARLDATKPFSNERFEDEVAKLLEFSRARPQYVLHETEQR